jgi:hypothetical protein
MGLGLREARAAATMRAGDVVEMLCPSCVLVGLSARHYYSSQRDNEWWKG